MPREIIDGRPNVCHPFMHLDIMACAPALAMAMHVQGQGGDAPLGEIFGEFKIVLLKISGAVANYNCRGAMRHSRQKEHALKALFQRVNSRSFGTDHAHLTSL
jgi:hypothetical protein